MRRYVRKSSGSGSGSGGDSNFQNIYQAVSKAASGRRTTSGDGAWRSYTRAGTASRQAQLEESEESDEREARTGKRSWDGSTRDAGVMESALGVLSQFGSGFGLESWLRTQMGGDEEYESKMSDAAKTATKVFDAAVTTPITSPIAAVGTALSSGAEAVTGTPYTEYEDGQIPDYELSGQQKIAAGLKAGLNAASLGWGDAANVVEIGKTAARWGAKKVAGDALTGAAKKAVSRLSKTTLGGTVKGAARTALNVGKEAAKDYGSEFVEESAESVFDDIRAEQVDEGTFGRAIEAGLYGGIGGATSSLARSAVQRAWLGKSDYQELVDMYDEEQAAEREAQGYSSGGQAANPPSAGQQNFARAFGQRGGASDMPADSQFDDQISKQAQKQNRSFGSSVKLIGADPTRALRPDRAIVGVAGLRQSYRSKDGFADQWIRDANSQSVGVTLNPNPAPAPGDRDGLAAWRAEERRLWDDLMLNGTDADVAARLRGLGLAGKMKVTVKTDPATSNANVYALTIDDFSDGAAIFLNQALISQQSKDCDGDLEAYTTRGAEAARSPMELLSTPGVGDSGEAIPNLDDKYLGFRLSYDQHGGLFEYDGKGGLRRVTNKFTSRSRNRATRRLRNTLAHRAITRAMAMSGVDPRRMRGAHFLKFVDEQTRLLVQASVDQQAGVKGASVAAQLAKFQVALVEWLNDRTPGKVVPVAPERVGQVANDVMANLFVLLQTNTSQEAAVAGVAISMVNAKRANARALDAAAPAATDASTAPVTPGSIGDARTQIEVDQAFGTFLGRYIRSGSNNPFMRHAQLLGWPLSADRDRLRAFDEETSTFDNLQRFVAASLGKLDPHTEPLDVVSGLFKVNVMSNTLRRLDALRPGGRLGAQNGYTFDEFSQAFIESYNAAVDLYNQAFGDDSQNGDVIIPKDSPLREKITGVGDSFYDAVFMSFEHVAMGEIFDLSGDPELAQMSFGAYMLSVNDGYGPGKNEMITAGESASRLVDGIVDRYPDRVALNGRLLEAAIEANAPSMALTFNADGSISLDDPYVRAHVAAFWAVYQYYLGPEVVTKLGITNFESFAASPFAAGLMSRDAEIRKATAFKMMLQATYTDVAGILIDMQEQQRIANDDGRTKSERRDAQQQADRLRARALNQAKTVFGLSPLHDRISTDLIEAIEKNDDVIDLDDTVLADVLTKDREYSQLAADGTLLQRTDRANLMECASRTTSSSLEMSSVSVRLTSASQRAQALRRMRSDMDRRDFDYVESLMDGRVATYDRDSVWSAVRHVALSRMSSVNEDVMGQMAWDAGFVNHEDMLKNKGTDTQDSHHLQVAQVSQGGERTVFSSATGHSLHTITMREFQTDPRYVIDVLYNDGRWRISDGGTAVVDRRSLFKSAGIDLSGPPTTADYEAFYRRNPQILAMFCDTRASVSIGVDGVSMRSSASAGSRVLDHLKGKDATRVYEREVQQIKNVAATQPTVQKLVIGNMAARGLDGKTLFSSRKLFVSEYRKSLESLCQYVHWLVANYGRDEAKGVLEREMDLDYATVFSSALNAVRNTVARREYEVYYSLSASMEDEVVKSMRAIAFGDVNAVAAAALSDFLGQDVEANASPASAIPERAMRCIDNILKINRFLLLSGVRCDLAGLRSQVMDEDFLNSIEGAVRALASKAEAVLGRRLTADEIRAIASKAEEGMRSRISDGAFDGSDPDDWMLNDSFSTDALIEAHRSGDVSEIAEKLERIYGYGQYAEYEGREHTRADIERQIEECFDPRTGEPIRVKCNKLSMFSRQAVVTRINMEMGDIDQLALEFGNEAMQKPEMLSALVDAVNDSGVTIRSDPNTSYSFDVDYSDPELNVLSQAAQAAMEKAGTGVVLGIQGAEYNDQYGIIAEGFVDSGVGTQGEQATLAMQAGFTPTPSIQPMKARALSSTLSSPGNQRKRRRLERAKWRFVGETEWRSEGLTTGALNRIALDPNLKDEPIEVLEFGDCPYPDRMHDKDVEATGQNEPKSAVVRCFKISLNYLQEAWLMKATKVVGRKNFVVAIMDDDPELGRGKVSLDGGYNVVPSQSPSGATAGMLDPASAARLKWELKEKLRDHREDVADHIYSCFDQAKVDDTLLGHYATDIIAQTTTPILVVRTADGVEHAIAVSTLWETDPSKANDFAEKLAELGVDPNDKAVEWSFPTIPYNEVANRIGKALADDPIVRESTTEQGAERNRAQLESVQADVAKRVLDDWDDYCDASIVGRALAGMGPSQPDFGSTIAASTSASPNARFMTLAEGVSGSNLEAVTSEQRSGYEALSENERREMLSDMSRSCDSLIARGVIVSAEIDVGASRRDDDLVHAVSVFNTGRYVGNFHKNYGTVGGRAPMHLLATRDVRTVRDRYDEISGQTMPNRMLVVPKSTADALQRSSMKVSPMAVGTETFTIKGDTGTETFVIIDPTKDPTRFAADFETPAPSLVHVSNPDQLLLGIALNNMPDSAAIGEDGLLLEHLDKTSAFQKSALFPYRGMDGTPEVVSTRDGIDAARRAFNGQGDDIFVFPKVLGHDIRDEAHRRSVDEFFNKCGGWSTNGYVKPDGTNANDCVAIVRMRNPMRGLGAEYIYSYVPYIPGSGGPREGARTTVFVSDSNADTIVLGYSGDRKISKDEVSKVQLSAFTGKFEMAGGLDDNVRNALGVKSLAMDVPVAGGRDNLRYRYVLDANAMSRQYERDRLLKINLNSFMVMVGGGLCMKSDGNGKVVMDEDAFNAANGGNVSVSVLRRLLSYRSIADEWRDVASGRIKLSTDNEVNRAVQAVVANILEYNRTLSRRHLTTISPAVALGGWAMDSNGEIVSHMMTSTQSYAFYKSLSTDQLLKLFHEINPNLCRDGVAADEDGELVDDRGYVLMNLYDGNVGYVPAVYDMLGVKEDGSQIGTPSDSMSWSDQQSVSRYQLDGVFGEDARRDAMYFDSLRRRYGRYDDYMVGGSKYRPDDDRSSRYVDIDEHRSQMPSGSRESAVRAECQQIVTDAYSRLATYVEDYDSGRPADEARVNNARLDVRNAYGFGPEVDDKLIDCMIMAVDGYAYNDGRGMQRIDVKDLEWAASMLAANVRVKGKAIVTGGQVPRGGRISMSLMPRWMMRAIWTHSEKVRASFSSYDKFVDAAVKQQAASDEQILKLVDSRVGSPKRARLNAMSKLSAGLYQDNGLEPGIRLVLPFGVGSRADIEADMNVILKSLGRMGAMSTEGADMARSTFDERLRELEGSAKTKAAIMSGPGGSVSWVEGHANDAGPLARLPQKALRLSRCLTMMDAQFPISNIEGRIWGNVQGRAQIGIAQAFGGRALSEDIPIDSIVRDERTLRTFCAIRALREMPGGAMRNASELAKATLESGGDVASVLMDYCYGDQAEKAYQNFLRKIERMTYELSSGLNVGVHGQIKNFLEFLYLSLDDTNEIDRGWLAPVDEAGHTRFEKMLLDGNCAGLMTSFLVNMDNLRDLDRGSMAYNRALVFDRAQQDCVVQFFNEFMRIHPIGELLFSLNVTKFGGYLWKNQTYFLNKVAPMSCVCYLIRNWMVDKAQGDNPFLFGVDLRGLPLEESKMYDSFLDALKVDAMTMGTQALVSIIMALFSLRPPEDDEGEVDELLVGNIWEWTWFGGHRIADSWSLYDVCGPSLAIAATMLRAMDGDLRVDILGNWYLKAMSNNPVLTVGGVIGSIMDPDGGIEAGLIAEEEMYADAADGAPGALEWIQAKMATTGLTWATTLFVPTFLRNFLSYTGGEMEKSYKLVQKVDQYGNPVVDDDGNPEYVKTEYLDQQIRKITRNNPLAGIVMDVISSINGRDTPTGYAAWEMPNTVYYDEDELESMEYFSVTYTDDSGNTYYKSQEECNSIALEVINMLSTEDIDDLEKAGIIIPYQTREYISKVLWDEVHALDEQWNSWFNETNGGDANVVAEMIGGDFNDGLLYYKNAKSSYWDDRNMLTNLYDVLWDSRLQLSLTKYNRYKTSYAQDANGDWYATGYRSSFPFTVLTGLQTAEGSYDYWGDTLGPQGQWETPSAKNDTRSAGGRALVAVEETFDAAPDISSWSEDGEGEEYSDMSGYTIGGLLDGSEFGSMISDLDEADATYSNYYYGGYSGGRYYSRSYGGGGGGGSSYTPNIYSRVPSVNYDTAKTMYDERIYSPDFDYLRPEFERKGSREAYKRSDI